MEVLKMSYNGWQNYETWLASVYLGDVDWQNFVETALLGGEEDEEITEDKKVEMLAEYLKDYIEEEADMAGLNGFLDDLLTSAISEIDFTELATAFLDV
jgi:predicted house-cleaning noncanonical NTP pyrophosphatase (MazG superfamily)